MAIMVAGGLTFAVPGTEPVFAEVNTTNPHLYVSAEGQDADNQFAEGNIIEVIIRDDSIGDTDEGEAEPEVSINGADLRMLQAANGDWRAYFAQANAIASIDAMNGELDYGEYCSENAASTVSTLELSDTNGVYFPPGSVDANCAIAPDDMENYHPLIRETRQLTDYNPAGDTLGQLGLSNDNLWPFIQVFDFAHESDVKIVYSRGGSEETVTLEFDDPSESHSLDRTKYPQGAHVLVTIEDYALNIDPTDEDTWAFDTANKRAYYNLFDEDGTPVNIMNAAITDYAGSAGIGEQLSIERSGQGGAPLLDCQVTKDFGIQDEDNANMDYLVSNDDSAGACVPTDNISSNSAARGIFTADNFVVGFVEDGSNNNQFINWAEDQRANLVVSDDAQRNRSFEIDYNAPGAISGVVGHFFAELTLGDSGATWNSGERIGFTVTDEDANTNPLAENDLTVANPHSMLVPSIRIGDPTTLSSATGNVVWVDLPDDAPVDSTLPRITITGDNPAMVGWNTSYTDAGATCTDTVDSNPTIRTTSNTVDLSVAGSYTVTYTCTDDSSNSATATRTVTVTSPVITITGDNPHTIAKGTAYSDAGATCVDDNDGAITTITTTPGAISTTNVGEQTITYTCTDSEGNTATAMRTVMVTDQAMPIITIRGGSTATVAQGATYNDAGATCVDADDQSDITAITSNASAIDTSMVGTQVIQYSCTDAQGNTFTQIKTVTIEDKTKPVIVITGDNPHTISQSTMPYDDPGAVCTDNHDANKTATAASTVVRGTVDSYEVTYTCTDAGNNAADPVTRDVIVIADNVPPTIEVQTPTMTVSVNSKPIVAPTALCTDNLDDNKNVTGDITNVDLTTKDTYTVTYDCADAAGNNAAQGTSTIVVGDDTTDPVLSGVGDATIMVGTAFDPEMGVTCIDDATLPTSLAVGSNVNINVDDTYEVVYVCTDGAENAVSHIRMITVTSATTPEISISGGDAVDEGGNVEFTLMADPVQTADLDVTVSISQQGDYVTSTSQMTVTIPPSGTVMFNVTTVDDNTDEPNGSVTATVSSGTGYTVSATNGMVTVTVRDNDGITTPTLPVLSIAADSQKITEGEDAIFTITSDSAPDADLDVMITVTDNGEYIDGTAPTTVTIPADSTMVKVTVMTDDDNANEDNGSIMVTIDSDAAYGISTSTASIAVDDNDEPTPSLMLTSITGEWIPGNEVTLTIMGTSMYIPVGDTVMLTTDDIPDFAPQSLTRDPDTGAITGTVTIDDIRVSDATEFKLVAGTLMSDVMTGDIPRLLEISSHEISKVWSAGTLEFDVNGTSDFLNRVTLIVVDEDGSETMIVDDDTTDGVIDVAANGTILHQDTLRLENTTLAGETVTLKLKHDGLSERFAFSENIQITLPPLLELTTVGTVDNKWNADILKIAVEGTSGVTTNIDLIAIVDGNTVKVADVPALSDTNVISLTDNTNNALDLANVTLAGKTVEFKLAQTDDDGKVLTVSNGKTRTLPDLVTLESVRVSPSWSAGNLDIEVEGSAGIGSTNVNLVALYMDEQIEVGGDVTVGTEDGKISHKGTTALPLSNITLAGQQVTLALKATDADGDTTLSKKQIPVTLPVLLELNEVRVGSWSDTGVLSLDIDGSAGITTGKLVAIDADGSETESADLTFAPRIFGLPVLMANVTLAEKAVTFKLNATKANGETFESNVISPTPNTPLPKLFDLKTVDAYWKGDAGSEVLNVNITGTSVIASGVTLAIFNSSNLPVLDGTTPQVATVTVEADGTIVAHDGSEDATGPLTFDNAAVRALNGTNVFFKLTATIGANDAFSNEKRVMLKSFGTDSSNVDMTPTPISFSTNSGFPPITRAVINDISEIPAIHSVLKVIPADKTVGYDFSASNGVSVESFSDRLRLAEPTEVELDIRGESAIVIEGWERPMFMDGVTTLFNWNFDSLSEHATVMGAYLGNGTHKIPIATGASGLVELDKAEIDMLGGDRTDLIIKLDGDVTHVCSDITLVADFFTFGQTPDGDRVNNAIYRLEVEEATPNSADFEATLEYVMLNQLNVDNPATYTSLRTIDSDVSIIVHEDFTDEDSVRINYFDLGADGVSTQIAIQREAPTHSGVVSFDMDSYKIADTVTITLEDADLNVDNDVVDIYTFDTSGTHPDMIGDEGAFILDVTFDDEAWTSANCGGAVDGFASTGFTLMETASGSGVFTGDFQIPEMYCQASSNSSVSVTGVDIEVNYQDFRDASGEEIEVGAGAAIRANTGTVSLDRTVYPVPFDPAEYGTATDDSLAAYDVSGDLGIHIRVTDADFDVSAAGEDTIVNASEYLTVKIIRGAESTTIDLNSVDITEVAPDAGVFELDLTISHNVGGDIGQIQQGDIIQVEYEDPTDASGEINTVTDSATFDLRNAVLQSDKSVYIIGSDMILTLIEPDFDLDNDGAETYPLDLIEWDSDAATVAMGSDPALDPEPNGLRETGDSTGIYQSIIEIPGELEGDRLERGEEIELEYVDYGPSGSDYVGDETEDITLTVFTSNFGATIELDQKVYTWTDKVYITIVAPDHNFDSALVDEIGESDDDPIRISTRSDDIDNYKLVETGADTGIFTGEIILIGFDHNADGETTTGTTTTGYDNPQRETSGSDSGPTNGYIKTDDDDGITVSFEFSEDETVVGSALIRWNIGEVQWLEASYPATGTGVVRVIDPDMNLNPESVDNFDVDVWSDKDAGGIDLTVTETNQATGIFEGTVFFTTADESSGHRLRVAEGDTVTAEYEDNTLPDPYTTADELDITATTLIGTMIPPLERAVVSNLRTVDAFENSLDTVSVDQQVQIVADLTSGQDRSQMFAYLVQVQDANGVTVSLAWISGTLEAGQSLSPSSSWIPTEAGTYTATAFVWESVDNPTALSPPVTTTITVS